MNTLHKVLFLALPLTLVACTDDETETTPPSTFTAVTYNLGLAPGFVEAVEGRTAPTIEFAAGIEADLLCVQEAWFSQAELESASADKWPNTVFVAADEGMTGSTAACTMAESQELLTCAQTAGCDMICADQLVPCALQNCGMELGALQMDAPGCYDCIVAGVGLPFNDITESCLSASKEYAFKGEFGQGILTGADVIASDNIVLGSSINRRAVTYAHVDTPVGEIHAFCTHLSAALSSVPYPANGAYDSWEAEQNGQIDDMIAFIDSKVTDGQVLLMGDFNTGPGGEGYDAEYPDNYDKLIAAGYGNPYTATPGHGCTFCADNAINAKDTSSDKKNSVLIDHILVKGFGEGSASADYSRIGEGSVEVENCDMPVTTAYSDHYGVSATFAAN